MNNEKQNKKTIIVLGMHRSGTSITAGILKILGVDMGNKLIKKNSFNVRGYFEDDSFRSLNDKILKSVGASWHNPPDEDSFKIKQKFIKKIKKLLSKRYKNKTLWGWKDPRTVLNIDLFLPYLTNPYFILCFRNDLDIAKSIKKRDNFAESKNLKLTKLYNKRIENFCLKYPSLPKIYINFNNIIKNPIQETEKISHFLDIQLTKQTKQKIKKFIVPTSDMEKEKNKLLFSTFIRCRMFKILKKPFTSSEKNILSENKNNQDSLR